MDFLQNRVRRVIETLMGNEALAEGLETSGAQALQDWGIALAHGIVASTTELDDEMAEVAMTPRLKATRKLMRFVGQWVARREELSPEDRQFYWKKILENASLLYGDRFEPMAEEQFQALIVSSAPADVIALMREKFESRAGGERV